MDIERWRVNIEIASFRVKQLVTTAVQLASLLIVGYGAWGILELGMALPTEQPAIGVAHYFGGDPFVTNGFIVLAGGILGLLVTSTR